MQDGPTTKPEILARTQRAVEAFDAALAKLSDVQMEAAQTVGEWSVRNLLAHFYTDLRWFSGQMTALNENRTPTAEECFGEYTPPGPEFDLSTPDGRNAFHQARTRHLPLAEVKQLYARYRDRMLEVVAALPSESFGVDHTIAEGSDAGWVRPVQEGEMGWPLWVWVQGATWHHFEDHLKDVEAASRR